MTEETLFVAASRKTTAAARAAFLDEACAGDTALRARVEARLQSEGDTGKRTPLEAHRGDRLSEPADDERPTVQEPAAAAIGTRIGPYKLLQQLGEGGFGVVYLAEQEEPVRRRVALKIIKAGMDSAQVIARFEQERQALAMMDHPNIAKVLDAGTVPGVRRQESGVRRQETGVRSQDLEGGLTPDCCLLTPGEGRPYFVMELVKGVPITKYCDREQLTPVERLQLFIPVCQAIQHAHQKGIIHRDLKPSNILVALYDGRAVPKVIDFGVAKATGQRLIEQTPFTEIGQIIGTLEYMSPEQAEMNNLDIDTRTDIYSLGVLLYELLTGTTPLSRKELTQASFTQMLRIIREQEPERPSTRLSKSTEALPTRAAQRRLDPKQMRKLLSGDLDWIVMKALAKERSRRYETANDFAQDIERFLKSEPVLAGPPTLGYRLRKFVDRNRGWVVAACLVLAALVAGIIGTTWGMIRARHAEAVAGASLISEARARTRTVEALHAMTDDVIEKLFAQQARLTESDKAFLRKVLTYYQGFASEQGETEQARAVAAGGQLRVAKVNAFLGERRAAEAGYRTAIRQFERLVDESPVNAEFRRPLALGHNNLGALLVELGKHEEAETHYRKSLDLGEKLAAEFPDERRYRQALGTSYHNLGIVLRELKRHDAAETAYGQALELRKKLMTEGPDVPDYRKELAGTYLNLGILQREMSAWAEAETTCRRALELREKLVADFPAVSAYRHDLALTYNSLGILLHRLKRRVEAEGAFRHALELREKVAGEFPGVPQYQIDLAGGYVNFARLILEDGRAEESLGWFDRAVAILDGILKNDARVVVARGFLSKAHAGRAEALATLKHHSDAVLAWDKAFELDDGSLNRPVFRLSQAHSLCLAGDHRRASMAAEELSLSPGADGATLYYNCACILALCAGAAKDDGKESESYAVRAMALLNRAMAAGFAHEKKHLEQLKIDKDLDALRSREDFRKLLKDLEN
jgi:serine/threonine protein kinase/Flp pilus assembly protein TadD